MSKPNADLMLANWTSLRTVVEAALVKNGVGDDPDPQRIVRAFCNEDLMMWLAQETNALSHKHDAALRAAEEALRAARGKCTDDFKKLVQSFKAKADAAAAEGYQ